MASNTFFKIIFSFVVLKKGLKHLLVSENGEIIIPEEGHQKNSTKTSIAVPKINLKKRRMDNERHHNSNCFQKDDANQHHHLDEPGQQRKKQPVTIRLSKVQIDNINEGQRMDLEDYDREEDNVPEEIPKESLWSSFGIDKNLESKWKK